MTIQKVDWQALHQRLNDSRKVIEQGLSAQPDKVASIFKERAERLKQQTQTDTAQTFSVLSFELNTQTYALPLTPLERVHKLEKWAILPGMPPDMLGITNVRGHIRPVASLSRILGFSEEDACETVVFFKAQYTNIGLAIGAIDRVRSLKKADLIATLETTIPFISGLTHDGLTLLNAQAILARPIFQQENAD